MAKKTRRPPPRPPVPDEPEKLEVSPAFRKEPPTMIVVRGAPPDIPRNVIPVLRKAPVVFVHKPKPVPKTPTSHEAPIKKEPPPGKTPVRTIREERIVAERDWTPPPILKKQLGAPRPQIEARTSSAPVPAPAPQPRTREPRTVAPSRSAPIRLADAPTILHPVRERSLTQTGLLGAAIFAVTIVALILYQATPWLEITGEPTVGPSPFSDMEPGPKDAGDLRSAADDSTYFGRLLNWPFSTLLWSCLLGATLFGVDQVPRMRVDHHRFVQTFALASLLFAGFVEFLAGARWIGLYVSTVLDEGPTPAYVLVFPYISILLGMAQVFVVARMFRRKATIAFGPGNKRRGPNPRIAHWSVLAVALTLLLLPIVPVSWIETNDGTAFVQEAELEAGTLDDPLIEEAGKGLAFARGVLWITLYLALAATALAAMTRTHERPVFHALFVVVYGAMLPVLLSAVVATIVAQVAFWRIGGANTFLAVPFAGVAALAGLYVLFVREELVPYLRRLPALPE